MKTITKEFSFESAHRLFNEQLNENECKDIWGKCYNIHGHSYKLFVTVSGIERNGMIINFTKFKELVNEVIIYKLDHKLLNEVPMLKGKLTTCEVMIEVIWDKLNLILKEYNCQLKELKLYETSTSYATMTDEN